MLILRKCHGILKQKRHVPSGGFEMFQTFLNILYFHPNTWGDDPIWRAYVFKWVETNHQLLLSSTVSFHLFSLINQTDWSIYLPASPTMLVPVCLCAKFHKWPCHGILLHGTLGTPVGMLTHWDFYFHWFGSTSSYHFGYRIHIWYFYLDLADVFSW